MNMFVILASWVNSHYFRIFWSEWSLFELLLLVVLVQRRSIRLKHFMPTICLCWSCSWNLPYFLCWLGNCRIDLVMVAVFCWLLWGFFKRTCNFLGWRCVSCVFCSASTATHSSIVSQRILRVLRCRELSSQHTQVSWKFDCVKHLEIKLLF